MHFNLTLPMPYVKIYVHLIWSTKNRVKYLDSPALRIKMWNHIRENAKEKGIHLDFVNGFIDHCHCLVSLRSDQTVKDIVHLIKGESSAWINKQGIVNGHFGWQRGYFALGVSESRIEIVRNYIRNQEDYHRRKTWGEECEEFILRHGFEYLDED